MGFTPGQQGVYRPLVKRAWGIHCARNGIVPKDRAAYDVWYPGEVMKVIGKDSTKHANTGKDFDLLKAHFMAICGDSIEAEMQVFKQDSKRIIFLISEICKEHNITDAYVLGTARNITGIRSLNNLHQIEDKQQLHKVRTALIIHAKRLKKKAEEKAPKKGPEVPSENCPF